MVYTYAPLAIYVVSSLLLYFETCLITSALDHVRRRPHTFNQSLIVYCLLMPLLLLPVVPVVLMFSLDQRGVATTQSLVYAGIVWIAGLSTAVPAYWYATRPIRAQVSS
jgi:hypothetical protein